MKPDGALQLKARVTGVTVAAQACGRHHRHLPEVSGGLVGIEIVRRDTGWPCAWGIVGRAVARVLDQDGWIELLRGIVPDGAPPNCASMVLGCAARWARKRGSPIVTYTLEHEPGTSLLAAGWVQVGWTQARKTWASAGRPRADRTGVLRERKRRWVSAKSIDAALARGWKIT